MRKWAPWLALVAVVVVALGVLIARSEPSNSIEARAKRLEKELACPVCVGESLAESNAPEARAMRADIRDRMEDGQTDSQIVAAYVLVYGEDIKLKPGDDGFALVAWGVPVVALIVGAGLLTLAFRRWSREPRLAATADDEVVVARERQDHP